MKTNNLNGKLNVARGQQTIYMSMTNFHKKL